MKRWVDDGLEQSSVQLYWGARSCCLCVNLLVRGSSFPPLPHWFSCQKKEGSILIAYWPAPAAINKHKVAWLTSSPWQPWTQGLHYLPVLLHILVPSSLGLSLFPSQQSIPNNFCSIGATFLTSILTYGIMVYYQPYMVLLLWLPMCCLPYKTVLLKVPYTLLQHPVEFSCCSRNSFTAFEIQTSFLELPITSVIFLHCYLLYLAISHVMSISFPQLD